MEPAPCRSASSRRFDDVAQLNQPADVYRAGSITVIDGVGTLGLGLMLLIPSLALTAGALWLAARLAPWFLKERFRPLAVRSFFLDMQAEAELDRTRMMTLVLAAAIILAVLVPVLGFIRFSGLIG